MEKCLERSAACWGETEGRGEQEGQGYHGLLRNIQGIFAWISTTKVRESQGDVTMAQENSAPTKELQAFQDVHVKRCIF